MWRIIWGKCRSTISVRDHLPRTRRGINSNRAPATYKWRTIIHTPPWEIVIRTSSVTGCFEVREEHKNCRDGTSFVISIGFGIFLIDWYKMRQRMRSQEHTNAASKNTWKIVDRHFVSKISILNICHVKDKRTKQHQVVSITTILHNNNLATSKRSI